MPARIFELADRTHGKILCGLVLAALWLHFFQSLPATYRVHLNDFPAYYGAATPKLVTVGTFNSLSLGSLSTCGVVSGGEVYCWGYGPYGQLGDGTRTTRYELGGVALDLDPDTP